MSRLPGTYASRTPDPLEHIIYECPYPDDHVIHETDASGNARTFTVPRWHVGGTGNTHDGVTFRCILGHEWFVPFQIPLIPDTSPDPYHALANQR